MKPDHPRCSECRTKAARAWRDKPGNAERVNERSRKHREQNPEKYSDYYRRSKRKYSEKVAARQVLSRALQAGTIVKDDCCEDCGEFFEDARRLHGHHEDYSKPLEVNWLCVRCHAARHRLEGKG